jgi:transcriptional regulator with XRE-family HTH domain
MKVWFFGGDPMFVSYNLEDFGKELRRIRTSLGFSQADVQRTVAVSIDTIRKIESGRVVPRYDTLELLSVAYKRDLLELLKGCRSNKFLMEFHDDLDYIITVYDNDAAAALKKRLLDNFSSDFQMSIINPLELKQFIGFVDAIDAFYSDFTSDRENTMVALVNALRLTIPDFTLKNYKNYTYDYIEFRILLFISLFIAKDGDYILSNKILYYILSSISDSKFTTKYIDFLTINIYFNIAYNYHMLDEHAKVIETANDGIAFCIEHRTSHALFSLYYRKGIAQFNLRDKGYRESITMAFYVLKAMGMLKLLEQYQKITDDKYGIWVNM